MASKGNKKVDGIDDYPIYLNAVNTSSQSPLDEISINYYKDVYSQIAQRELEAESDYQEYYDERDYIQDYNTTLEDLDKKYQKILDDMNRLKDQIKLDIKIKTGTEYPVYTDIDVKNGIAKKSNDNTNTLGYYVSYDNGSFNIEQTYFK